MAPPRAARPRVLEEPWRFEPDKSRKGLVPVSSALPFRGGRVVVQAAEAFREVDSAGLLNRTRATRPTITSWHLNKMAASRSVLTSFRPFSSHGDPLLQPTDPLQPCAGRGPVVFAQRLRFNLAQVGDLLGALPGPLDKSLLIFSRRPRRVSESQRSGPGDWKSPQSSATSCQLGASSTYMSSVIAVELWPS